MKLRRLLLSAVVLFPISAHADQIQVLNRGDQSLSAFYTSIVGAKQSIDLASFLFEPCESAPKLLLDAMVKKARNGVKIRLLVDAYNQKQPNKAGLATYLAGVPDLEFRYYNNNSTLLTANNRSHIKAFVVDGRTDNRAYIVGGRNMSDDYFGLGAKMNYLDQDLLIRGKSADTAQKQFEELWNAGSRAGAGGDAAAFAASCLKPNARDLTVAKLVSQQAASILSARPVRSCREVEYALDRPDWSSCPGCNDANSHEDPVLGEGLQRKRMTTLFLDFVGGTRRSLQIANQYFMPYFSRPTRALERLRDEGRPVQILTNATGDIENVARNEKFTCHIQISAIKHTKGSERVDLISSKGALNDRWELSPAGAAWRIHTKSAVRDGRDVLVSSWNIDPRSYNVNLESGVMVEDCPELAADVSEQYEQLRGFVNDDRSCAGCKADIKSENRKKDAFQCGGEPLFY